MTNTSEQILEIGSHRIEQTVVRSGSATELTLTPASEMSLDAMHRMHLAAEEWCQEEPNRDNITGSCQRRGERVVMIFSNTRPEQLMPYIGGLSRYLRTALGGKVRAMGYGVSRSSTGGDGDGSLPQAG